jgi:hypothetical protein
MPSERPEMPIGEAEREHVASLLGRHFAKGRLTITEYEDRLDAVYAARTRADATDLLADLPAEPRSHDEAVRAPVRTRRTPWTPWALTGAICLLAWVTTSLAQGRPLGFWPGWAVGPWGIVLLARRWAPPDDHCAHRHTMDDAS